MTKSCLRPAVQFQCIHLDRMINVLDSAKEQHFPGKKILRTLIMKLFLAVTSTAEFSLDSVTLQINHAIKIWST